MCSADPRCRTRRRVDRCFFRSSESTSAVSDGSDGIFDIAGRPAVAVAREDTITTIFVTSYRGQLEEAGLTCL